MRQKGTRNNQKMLGRSAGFGGSLGGGKTRKTRSIVMINGEGGKSEVGTLGAGLQGEAVEDQLKKKNFGGCKIKILGKQKGLKWGTDAKKIKKDAGEGKGI